MGCLTSPPKCALAVTRNEGKYQQSGRSKIGSDEGESGKSGGLEILLSNKGRLLGIGGILIVVDLVLHFARGLEVAPVLPIVGIVLFIAGVIYKPRKKKENVTSEAQ